MLEFDRKAFKAMNATEADSEMKDTSMYSVNERLRITAYLNSIAYNYNLNAVQKIDKNTFEARARK